jgi:Leucine-rich repeat (LRR) protein
MEGVINTKHYKEFTHCINFCSMHAGKIPEYLFNLPALQELSLSWNQFSCQLEDIHNPLSSSLSVIVLGENLISGSIPRSYVQLTSLEVLSLEANKLTGIVKLSSFWRLKNLSVLRLSNNMLSVIDGKDASQFSSLRNIRRLSLASCNLIRLPGVLAFLNEIEILNLSSNNINGVIPTWAWENWKSSLIVLNLSHNMFTSLEKFPSLIPMAHVESVDLSFNRLEGNVPIPLVNIRNGASVKSEIGIALDYSNNYFDSILPNFGEYLRKVSYLDLSNNKLNGHVQTSICSANELSVMDLSYNKFSGPVPSCLLESGKLNVLKLRENQFQGMLPEDIRQGCRFQTIDLNGNQIEGTLPRSLSNCQDLELLDVGNNLIVDYFPSWLGVLPHIRVLVLRSNQFSGTIWDNKGDHHINNSFPSLQILDLASNKFSGNIPKGWFIGLKSMTENVDDNGQALGHWANSTGGFYEDTVIVTFKGSELSFTKILATFNVIDFSKNSFDGPVPESIGRLVSLHGLNMSYNNFTGKIPSRFSNLSRLESMDLSWNRISGKIPQELASLTSLEVLNLSYNNLSGRIPQVDQFLTFSNSSFQGNAGLCGLPLSKQCDSPGQNAVAPPESNSLWQDKLGVILLFAFVGLGFGVGFALSFVLRLLCDIDR